MLIIWGGLLISISRAVQARLAAPSQRTPERATAAFGSPLHQPGTRLGARV